VSLNCYTTVTYVVIAAVMMCCECCFTSVIYNVMIALSSCCIYTWNTQSITNEVGEGSSRRNLFSTLIYKHIVVSLSKWLATIPV
jgi:hypothetical protein